VTLDNCRLLLPLSTDKSDSSYLYRQTRARNGRQAPARCSQTNQAPQYRIRYAFIALVSSFRLLDSSSEISVKRRTLQREDEERSNAKTEVICHVPRVVLDDLCVCLWLDFIEQAHLGISLNILTIRKPTTRYRAEKACKEGIRGFSVFHDRVWRLEISPYLQNRTTLKVLEFFAFIVRPWIDLLVGKLSEFSCI
jgi:hypothetical protein